MDEGFAVDPEIRFLASSGGAATAVQWLNENVLSRSRAELAEATGSCYPPARPCVGQGRIEAAPAPCVFIGRPCDPAAGHLAARLHPKLEANLGLSIAIFCASTPATTATLDLIRELGIAEPRLVESVRYRGRGWPGRFRARAGEQEVSETYAHSWHAFQSRRQWRCYICADHTGEFADVSVGDPWYREIPADEPGRSLVLARTERGHALIERAVAAGYLVLERAAPAILTASQPELLKTRGANWGRIQAMRLFGLPIPHYRGMPMLRFWWRELSLREKFQSVVGTVSRVFRKGLLRPLTLFPFRPGGLPWAGERRTVTLTFVIAVFAFVAFGIFGVLALLYGLPYALRRRAERLLARRCAAERVMVLSFDDGPGPVLTPQVLALLDRHGARATFFPVGERVRARPDLMSEIASRGHEIGCHSEHHGHSLKIGPARAMRDALEGLETLRPWLSAPPLFRPPFGKLDLATWALLQWRGVRLGWWTLDSGDTAGANSPAAIEQRLLRAGGGVVLLHDFDGRSERSDYVLAVTERLLVAARENDLQVVPLGDLT